MTWNEFFNWGENPKNDIEADIYMGVLQSKDSLYFLGDYSGNVQSAENSTSLLYTDIFLRFDIARFFAYRNTLVDNGSFLIDHQAFVSQNSINLKTKNDEKYIEIRYIKSIEIYESQSPEIMEVKI